MTECSVLPLQYIQRSLRRVFLIHDLYYIHVELFLPFSAILKKQIILSHQEFLVCPSRKHSPRCRVVEFIILNGMIGGG